MSDTIHIDEQGRRWKWDNDSPPGTCKCYLVALGSFDELLHELDRILWKSELSRSKEVKP